MFVQHANSAFEGTPRLCRFLIVLSAQKMDGMNLCVSVGPVLASTTAIVAGHLVLAEALPQTIFSPPYTVFIRT